MAATFKQLDSIEKLDDLFARSADAPVVIFKHSSSCGVSSMIYRRMTELDAEVNIIVVQTARDVSNEIVERTGIRHETPQAIVLRNGEPIYQASHYSIAPEAIEVELKD
jgi:bacillithiol system protein YtxJ